MNSETSCAKYAGVQDFAGLACCAAKCGTCGGSGCEERPGRALNCCPYLFYTKICGSGREAPCWLNGKYHGTVYITRKIFLYKINPKSVHFLTPFYRQ